MTNDCKTCPVSTGTHKPADAVHQIDEPQTDALDLADKLEKDVWQATPLRLSKVVELAAEALRAQSARIAELESQLEAIGAGGVEPLRKQAAAPQAVQAAVPEAIEQMAVDRYKVVPSHESMFHRWAVVAGNGTQQLYIGREGECQNMARKFMGAFLDGAFVAMQNAAPAHPAEGVPAQAVAVADARSARQIADAIVENFKDAGWSTSSIDDARVLEAVSAAIGEHGATEPLTGVASDVDSMARVLMAAFSKAEPEHPITRYPTSFVATFADMARAAIAAAQLADGVPAQSYVADFFREKGFYPSPAQAFAAGVAHAAAAQPAAQGMDALTPAARDVLAERKRQISAEGWTPESDDRYAEGVMSDAAGCYALHAFFAEAPTSSPPAWWPWADHWWKPTTPRRDLEKAGALILAEIERIDRAALAAQAKQGGAA